MLTILSNLGFAKRVVELGVRVFEKEYTDFLKGRGDFNKAILGISEVNRDQVISIRKLQEYFDTKANRAVEFVEFTKFKQTFPLEIGNRNGRDVLSLISSFGEKEKEIKTSCLNP